VLERQQIPPEIAQDALYPPHVLRDGLWRAGGLRAEKRLGVQPLNYPLGLLHVRQPARAAR
jgi:hypothetical protein